MLLSVPEVAIALDTSAANTPLETGATSAAINSGDDYSSVTTAVIEETAADYTGAAALVAAKAAEEAAKAKAKAEAEAKAKAAALKAKADAEAKAKAEAEAKAKKAKKAKEALKAKEAKEAKKTKTKNTDNPSGIPDEYTVKESFTVKAYAYSGGGTTASGRRARVGLIAVDPRVIPLGTILYIEGYGVCIAADTGGAIKGRTVDLYMDTERECRSWGKRNVMCYILTK
jgi:3D (Asp-Asp-Asp) domain-containing protein